MGQRGAGFQPGWVHTKPALTSSAGKSKRHIFLVLFLCLPSGNTILREAVPQDMKSCHDYIATSVPGLRSHPKMPDPVGVSRSRHCGRSHFAEGQREPR